MKDVIEIRQIMSEAKIRILEYESTRYVVDDVDV
jgi:hypothetical protein